MIVVVTGASGFVGRHLVPGLAAGGIEVRPVMRRLTEDSPPGSRLGALDGNWPGDWPALLEGADAVVHLAAHNPRGKGSDPDAFRRVNVEGTARLAREARKAGAAQFVFASSVRAYGPTTAERIGEDTPLASADPYGRSKADAEAALAADLAGGETGWTVLRPPAIYGPGGGGIPALIERAVRRGVPLPFSDARSRRSLLYVGNFVSAIRACLIDPPESGRVFNVADAVAPTYAELAVLIGQATGRPARLFAAPEAASRFASALPVIGEIVDRLSRPLVCDTTRITTELGWTPPFTTLEGLRSSFGKTRKD